MDIQECEIADVKLITPRHFVDARGSFCEIWSDRVFRSEVENVTFVQDNLSVSRFKGTVRGLHFQRPPFAQAKLIRVIRGSILDIAVDIREGSPSYGRHVAVELKAESGTQLWIPIGFLHGFCTLEDDTQVCYKVSEYYSPEHDAGVYWNDADLKIDWPVNPEAVVLSDKDQRHPRLAELPDLFIYREASPGVKLSAI
jgi:dTDP-4-dehydrorhamnose 3,5-epimerase